MKQICATWLPAAIMLMCVGCATVEKPVADTQTSAAPTVVLTATPVPTEAPTPSPTPEPEGETGVVRADGVGVLLTLLSRGYEASVTGEEDQYYRVLVDGTEAFVEKRFIRLSSEAAYESWKGYAKAKTEVYETAYLEGDPIAVLPQNTAITVLDAAGDTLLISWEDMQGYTIASNISKTQISYGGGGGGGGGGGADGGDISLSQKPSRAASTVRLSIRREEEQPPASAPAYPCAGTVIADATEAYLAIYDRGDTVLVISTGETSCEVLTDNGVGTIPYRLVQLLNETPYTEWDGFSDNNTPFYADYRMNAESEKLSRNTEVHILDDLGDCYLVMADGKIGYIRKTQVNEEKYQAPVGGGGGGGEWTEPVL